MQSSSKGGVRPSRRANQQASTGPLLASIGREIHSDALAFLLVQRQRQRQRQRRLARNNPTGPVDAECATHRSELRRAHLELERLGCHLVSLRPQLFCVEARQPGAECVLFSCADER